MVEVCGVSPFQPFGVGLLVGVAEEEELELGRAADAQPALGRPFELAPQDLSGRHLDRHAGLVGEVADDQGRPLEPRDAPRRGVVGAAHEVAVAGVPVGEAVTGQGVHVDVDREEVVARLDPVVGHVRGEEVSRDPLADRAPVHVGERHHDSVDGSVGDPSSMSWRPGMRHVDRHRWRRPARRYAGPVKFLQHGQDQTRDPAHRRLHLRGGRPVGRLGAPRRRPARVLLRAGGCGRRPAAAAPPAEHAPRRTRRRAPTR